MNKLRLEKVKYFDFEQCARQICRDPADSRAKYINGKIVVLVEMGKHNCLVSLEEQDCYIDVQTVYKSDDGIKDVDVFAYIRKLLDIDADLEPFYDRLNDSAIKRMFGTVFSVSNGLRIIGIPDLFQALTWAIIGQQISLAAAFSIKNRFCIKYGSQIEYAGEIFYSHPTASDVKDMDIEELRSIGLSRPKARYLLNIANEFAKNPNIQKDLEKQTTQEIKQYLLSFIGIGNWSCEYVLLKCLRQYDVYPVGDAALINAIKMIYEMDEKPQAEEIHQIFSQWQGWGGYLCFYIWYWYSSLKNNKGN